LLLVCVVRTRLASAPLERDEGEYAYAGQLILQGIPPYQLAYNMKLPGTYASYALLMALFGETAEGIHFGLMAVNAAAVFLMYLLGKRLFGSLAGAVAAAAYALLSLGPGVAGIAAHATHFVVLPALGGTLLLLRRPASRLTVAASGLLYGLAFLMKQPGIFFGIFGALWLLWSLVGQVPDLPGAAPQVGRSGTCPTRPLSSLALFFAGAALPFSLTCLALWRAGVFGRFWFWTFTYARNYATSVPFLEAWHKFAEQFPKTVGPNFVIWLVAAPGLALAFSKQRENRPSALFAAAFLVFSFAAVCPGGFFRPHYFILVLPAVALAAGAAIGPDPRWPRSIPCWLFAAGFLFSVAWQSGVFFRLTPFEVCRQTYGLNPFPEAAEVARYIWTHSPKDARIAVLGSEPEIYFLADRRSATGYIYTYPLMENQPYAVAMQREMIREIEAARPEYVVTVGVAASWLAHQGSPNLVFDWMGNYVSRNYQRVGWADIQSAERTVYQWDRAAASYVPQSATYLAVFRKRD
jgi:hypothetical protein